MSARIVYRTSTSSLYAAIPITPEVLAWRAAIRRRVLAPCPQAAGGRHGRPLCSQCGDLPPMAGADICFHCNPE